MKVLQITSNSDCHLAATVWDGLQDLLGESNVFDADNCKSHHLGNGDNPNARIAGSRPGCHLLPGDYLVTPTGTDSAIATARLGGTRDGQRLTTSGYDGDFDLAVVHSCFTRDHPHAWAASLVRERLKPGGKVAYVEGWDSAAEFIDPRSLGLNPTACFRREIDPSCHYPYEANCLMFAAPARWFRTDDHERPIDVFYAGNHSANIARWDVLEKMWQTKTRHWSIGASRGLDFDRYFSNLQMAKIGICPAGAAGGDGLRTWEVVAAGAIPIFVAYPRWRREPWFEDTVFNCDVGNLPGLLDYLLGRNDLPMIRQKMQSHALANHSTRARAEKILRLTGF